MENDLHWLLNDSSTAKNNSHTYFGTTSFDRKWLPTFPEEIIVRKDYAGICRYRMFI